MKYRVLKPMGFMRGEEGVTCWPGSIVEIDGNQARSMVAAGELESLGVEGTTGTNLDGLIVESGSEAAIRVIKIPKIEKPKDSE